ncbi:hypothetical protein KKD42_03405 [Patescibacteria group bacterium]|nr:hypothetical protein [Patescibacteria group bacterium]
MVDFKTALVKFNVGKNFVTPVFLTAIFAFFGIALLGMPKTASAAMCIYSQTTGGAIGDFNNALNWTGCGGVAPGVGDDVIITSGTSTQLSADTAISTINASGTIDAQSFGLNVTSTVVLNNGGVVTSTSGYLGFGGSMSIGNVGANKIGSISGAINVSSSFSFLGSSGVFDIGSGTSTFYGSVTFGQGVTLNGGTGTLEIRGSSLSASVTVILNMPTSKLLFSGSNVTTLAITSSNPTAFGDIVIDKSANYIALSSNVTSTGNLSINDGGLRLGSSTFRIGGNFIVNSGGTLTPETGTIELNGSGAQTVSSTALYNLTIAKSGGTATFAGNTTSTNNFSLTGGTLSLGSNAFNVGGDFTVNGGTFTPGTATTTLNGAGAQSVSSTGFYDLVVSKSGGTATFADGGMTVSRTLVLQNGTLNLGNGTTAFTAAGTPLQLLGGTLNPANGTVAYQETQTVASTTYYNLSITPSAAKTATLNASTTALGAVTVNANGTLVVGANDFTVLGTISNTGLITVSTGSIIHPAESVLITNSSGVEVSSLANPGSVYVTVQDSNINLDGSVAETITVSVSFNAAAGSDAETLTLTETGVATGIFRNSTAIDLVSSSVASTGNSRFELLASGIGTATYTDSQDATDSSSDTVTLTYAGASTVVTGGGGGGGGGPTPSPTTANPTPASISGPITTIDTVSLQKMQSAGFTVHQLVKFPDDGDPATQADTAVYYLGADGRRHAFPNSKVYLTWFGDYSGIKVIAFEDLSAIPLGRNVTYKAGRKMVKFTSDNKVYSVSKGGVLCWIKTEQLATELYGDNWNKQIDDIDIAFYPNYIISNPIENASDFSPSDVEASVGYPSDSMGIQG